MASLHTTVLAVFLVSRLISFVSGGEVVGSPASRYGCLQDPLTGNGNFVGNDSFDCLSLSGFLRTVSSNTTLYLDPGAHLIDQFIPIYGLRC